MRWAGRMAIGVLSAVVCACQSTETPIADEPPAPAAAAVTDSEADCVVIVDAEPDFGGPPLTVHFQTEVDCTSSPVKYAWDFGDGGPGSSVAHPSHTYERKGQYVAVVRVTAPDGATSDDAIDIAVDPALAE